MQTDARRRLTVCTGRRRKKKRRADAANVWTWIGSIWSRTQEKWQAEQSRFELAACKRANCESGEVVLEKCYDESAANLRASVAANTRQTQRKEDEQVFTHSAKYHSLREAHRSFYNQIYSTNKIKMVIVRKIKNNLTTYGSKIFHWQYYQWSILFFLESIENEKITKWEDQERKRVREKESSKNATIL